MKDNRALCLSCARLFFDPRFDVTHLVANGEGRPETRQFACPLCAARWEMVHRPDLPAGGMTWRLIGLL